MTATLTTTTAQGDDDVVWASPFQLATDETVDDNDRPVVRWALTHRATGLVVHADTLPDAMLYLSDPDAEGYLRHSAWDTALHPFATGEDKALMRRALVVFGDLLAPTVTPDHVCTCGGYLGRDAKGVLRHVDVCVDELWPNHPDDEVECPDPGAHAVCQTPAAARCEHGTCARDNDLNALPCEYGYDACCGCCHGEA